jgi:hypothetical protein
MITQDWCGLLICRAWRDDPYNGAGGEKRARVRQHFLRDLQPYRPAFPSLGRILRRQSRIELLYHWTTHSLKQGRYLPVFASEIYDQNELAKADGRKDAVINMKSVLIGNGNTRVTCLVAKR